MDTDPQSFASLSGSSTHQPDPTVPARESQEMTTMVGVEQVQLNRRGSLQQVTADLLAQEVPVALVYNGISHVVMMASPCDLELFALGFSLSEGIIRSPADIYGIDIEPGCQGISVQIELSSRCFAALKARRRTLAGRTGCGICGTEQLAEIYRELPWLPVTQRFSLPMMDSALAALRAVQEIGNLTGCTHAAVWLSPEGELLGGCEDIGRHVALDKLLGLRARHQWQHGVLLVSSRASYEMVQKAAMCGVEIVFAVSAATTLARQTALQCGLTLVAFTRPGRAMVLTHPERLSDDRLPLSFRDDAEFSIHCTRSRSETD